MKSAAISLVFAALSLATARGLAASRDPSHEFVVPDGLEVTLWAESPLFYKPTNIDVDQRGRIWVAEGVNYRTFRGKDVNQPEAIPFRHPDGDRIVILEDTDGDGVADSSKVFVQDKDLVAPLGVAVIGQHVFVSCSPHLLVYTLDASGDKPAKKEIFLTGFGGHDHVFSAWSDHRKGLGLMRLSIFPASKMVYGPIFEPEKRAIPTRPLVATTSTTKWE